MYMCVNYEMDGAHDAFCMASRIRAGHVTRWKGMLVDMACIALARSQT